MNGTVGGCTNISIYFFLSRSRGVFMLPLRIFELRRRYSSSFSRLNLLNVLDYIFRAFLIFTWLPLCLFISIFTSSACFPENRLPFFFIDKLVGWISLNSWYSMLSIDSSTSLFSSLSKIIRSCWKSWWMLSSLILASR